MNRIFIITVFSLLFFSCKNDQTKTAVEQPIVKMPKVEFRNQDDIKIAVIGAGIAGASYVHFMNQATDHKFDITVYERNNRLGGRVKKDSLGRGIVEQGATLIHSSNHYLKDIMSSYNLKQTVPHDGEGEAETLAIWNGNDFVLNTSANKTLSSLQMLWAYGRSLIDVQKEVKQIIPKWNSVYAYLQDGVTFKNPKLMFEEIGLYELTQQSSYDYFKKAGIKDNVVYEFIDCISRVNYHQDGNINAFTDLVSLAGAGLDGGSLFSVEGGNDLMIHSALNVENVDLKLNQKVTNISTMSTNFRDKHIVTSSFGMADTFDIVIVACPLDLAGISLPQHKIKSDREYQEVHAHFIAGEIDYSYFGNVSNNPQTIFTMEKEDVPFVSIARTGHAKEWDLPIYKVFSRTKLDDVFFNETFKNVKGQLHQEWKAYTVLSPMKEWPDFEISEGLYYIKSAVSTMETEAVSARNAANLSIEYLTREIRD